MKIEICNLGPIHHIEFDLNKDLHLIYGKNSIGKSYAVTTLYILLKNFLATFIERINNTSIFLFFGEETKTYWSIRNRIIESVEKHIKTKSDEPLVITDDIGALLKESLELTIIPLIEEAFVASFSVDTLQNRFSSEELSIDIHFTIGRLTISLEDEHLFIKSFNFNEAIELKFSETDAKADEYFIYVNRHSFDQQKLKDDLRATIFANMMAVLGEAFDQFDAVYFLPASRSGYYVSLSSFARIIVELSQKRPGSKIEFPALTLPVADYFTELTDLNNEYSETDLSPLIDKIETDILKGKVLFNEEAKKLFFQQDHIDSRLDLSQTSSMVAELSPLVAYLKYVLKKGYRGNKNSVFYTWKKNKEKEKINTTILFIEEPEAHLHPEVQVKLMEIFTELTKYNIKIFMTTHSNYMFNKLGNLLLAKKISPEKVGSYHMVMTAKGSIDKGDMKAEEDGMNDENFADVAEQLYEERLRLYDQLNEEQDVDRDN